MKGESHSLEARLKMSQSHKGKPSNRKGKFNSAAANRKNSETQKRIWSDPDLKKQRIKIILQGSRRRPTSIEQNLTNLIRNHGLPFKYVGNGEFILGGKCPDFLNTNGAKQLIELFGAFWHLESDVAKRTKHFAQYGFSTLIIWEVELDDTAKLLEKVKHFIKGKEDLWHTAIK